MLASDSEDEDQVSTQSSSSDAQDSPDVSDSTVDNSSQDSADSGLPSGVLSKESGKAIKEAKESPSLLGVYAPGTTPMPEQTSRQFDTPTISQAIDNLEYTQQNNDPTMAMPAWSHNQDYIQSLSLSGKPLTQKEYEDSVYARPGLPEKYPGGLTTDQAKELAAQYDLENTTEQQIKNMSGGKALTADVLSNVLTYIKNPINDITTVGAAVAGLGAGAGALASKLLPDAAPMFLSRTAAAGLSGFAEMGVSGGLNSFYHVQWDKEHGGTYSYLNAAADTATQSVYGLGWGGLLHLGITEPLGAVKQSVKQVFSNNPKPSDVINNASSGEAVKQTEDQVVNNAKDAVQAKAVPLQPIPEDLANKYTNTPRQADATPDQLKQAGLVGSDKDLGKPSDTVGMAGYAETPFSEHPLVKTPEETLAQSRADLSSAIDEHEEKFSDISEEDADKWNIQSLPDDLAQSSYRTKKYLQSDDALPYVADALNYLKDSNNAKPMQQNAYEQIKQGNEEALLDQYTQRAQKSISIYEENGDSEKLAAAEDTLATLQRRSDLLNKAKEFKNSLDNIDSKLRTHLGNQEFAYKDSLGRSLVSHDIDNAMINKASFDMVMDRPVDVRGFFKAGLADSPLLKRPEVPEGFEDLKNYSNNLAPTTDDIKDSFESEEPQEPMITDKDVEDTKAQVDRDYENLPEEIKREFQLPEGLSQDAHNFIDGVYNCLKGE